MSQNITGQGSIINGSAANPTSGNFDVSSISWLPGDVVLCFWYSRDSKTFTKPAAITQKVDTQVASVGHLFIGYRILQAGDTTFGWTGGSATNVTTLWGCTVFRNTINGSGVDPFEAVSGAGATTISNAQNMDPPAVVTVMANAMVVLFFGKNNDYGASITAPTGGYASADSAKNAEETSGTDGSIGHTFRVVASGGTNENPAVWTLGGAATDDGLTWSGSLRPKQLSTFTISSIVKKNVSASFTIDMIVKKNVVRAAATPTYVAQAPANATTVTLPAGWAAGDLALVLAFNASSSTVPSLPTGWTSHGTSVIGASAGRIGQRVLAATDTDIGTWTNATQVLVLIYRDAQVVSGTSATEGGAVQNHIDWHIDAVPGSALTVLHGVHSAALNTYNRTVTGGTTRTSSNSIFSLLGIDGTGINALSTVTVASVGNWVSGYFLLNGPGFTIDSIVKKNISASFTIDMIVKRSSNVVLSALSGDGYVASHSVAYSSARAGASLSAVTTSLYVANGFGGADFQCAEAFLAFDTNGYSGAATLRLYPITVPSAEDELEVSVATAAWRPTLTTADWIAGASLPAPLAGQSVDGSTTLVTLPIPSSAIVGNGNSEFILFSSSHRDNQQPAGNNSIEMGASAYATLAQRPKLEIPLSFSLDMWVAAAPVTNGSFTIDSIVKASVAGSFTIDEIVKKNVAGSFTVDEIVKKNIAPNTFTIDSIVKANRSGSFTVDEIVKASLSATLTIDSIIRVSRSSSFTIDSIARKTQAGSFTIDMLVARELIRDTFTRTESGQWGIADNGFRWDATNTIAEFDGGTLSVNGSVGALSATDIKEKEFYGFPVPASGLWVMRMRATGTVNGMYFSFSDYGQGPSLYTTSDGNIEFAHGGLFLSEPFVDGEWWRVKHFWGPDNLRVKIWRDGDPEPDWMDESDNGGSSGGGTNAGIFSSLAAATEVDDFTWLAFTTPSLLGNYFTINSIVRKSMAGSFTVDMWVRASVAGSFTVDEIVRASLSASLTVDEIVRATRAGSFTLDEWIRASVSGSFTVDELVRATLTASFTADEIVKASRAATFTVDEIVKASVSASFTIDIWVLVIGTNQAAFTVDEIVKTSVGAAFTIDELVYIVRTGTFTVDMWVRATPTSSFTVDEIVRASVTGSLSVDEIVRIVGAGSFTIDEIVRIVRSGTFSIDETVRIVGAGSFTLDELVRASPTGSLTVDEIVRASVGSSLTVDEIVRVSRTATFTIDEFTYIVRTSSFAVDEWVRTLGTGSFTVDEIVRVVGSGSFTVDELVKASVAGSFTVDEIVKVSRAGSLTIDEIVRITPSGSFALDELIKATIPGAFTVDEIVRTIGSGTFSIDELVRITPSITFTVDELVQASRSGSFTIDMWVLVIGVNQAAFSIDEVVKASVSGSFTVDEVVRNIFAGSFTVDEWIKTVGIGSFTVDELVRASVAGSFTANEIVRATIPGSFTTDEIVRSVRTSSITLNELVRATLNGSLSIDEIVRVTRTGSLTVDELVRVSRSGSFAVDEWVQTSRSGTFTVDMWVASATHNASFTVDSIIKASRSGTFAIDALVRVPRSGSLSIDELVRVTRTGSATLDSIVQRRLQAALTVDSVIQATRTVGVTLDILVRRRFFQSFTIDLRVEAPSHFTIDSWVQTASSDLFSIDMIVAIPRPDGIEAVLLGSNTIEAVLTTEGIEATLITSGLESVLWRQHASSFTISTLVRARVGSSFTIEMEVA